MADRPDQLQIMLTPEQTQALTDMARAEGQPVVELVEKILQAAIERREDLARRQLAQQLEALEQVKQHRAQILAARQGQPLTVDLGAVLQEIREERDDELFQYPINRN